MIVLYIGSNEKGKKKSYPPIFYINDRDEFHPAVQKKVFYFFFLKPV